MVQGLIQYDTSLLFFFLILAVIFINSGLFSSRTEFLLFFLLLVLLFGGYGRADIDSLQQISPKKEPEA